MCEERGEGRSLPICRRDIASLAPTAVQPASQHDGALVVSFFNLHEFIRVRVL